MLAKDPAIKMLIVGGAYLAGITTGVDATKVYLSPINPAIAASIVFFEMLSGTWEANGSFV